MGICAPVLRVNAADLFDQFKGVKKIWWDSMELKPGQIGRLIVLEDTPLFKEEGDIQVFTSILKFSANKLSPLFPR